MRLEPFCRVSIRYGAASWHRPYSGEEGLGFGQGDGSVTGELEGAVVWASYPRRREDGVWTPNLRGTISTAAAMRSSCPSTARASKRTRPATGAPSSPESS